MSRLRVVVSDHVFENFAQEEAILDAVGADLVVLQCQSNTELARQVAGAHGILNTYLPGMDATVFDEAPALRAVVRYGIGLDTIDIPEATRRGIVVANVPDYCIDEVADHALAHFLALARKLPQSDRKVRAGEWSLSCVKPLPAIRAMRVGILGFGRIGRAIARRLAPFGCEVVYADPIAGPSDGASPVSLDEVWASCHAIIVQCPSTAETYHLVGRESISRMRCQPLLINCARGAIVDTDAVVWGLEQGLLSGAGLDLLEDEEAVVQHEHPLKQFDQVILTPHSAWYSAAAIPSLQRRAAEEMARVLRGEKPLALVNPEVWEDRRT